MGSRPAASGTTGTATGLVEALTVVVGCEVVVVVVLMVVFVVVVASPALVISACSARIFSAISSAFAEMSSISSSMLPKLTGGTWATLLVPLAMGRGPEPESESRIMLGRPVDVVGDGATVGLVSSFLGTIFTFLRVVVLEWIVVVLGSTEEVVGWLVLGVPLVEVTESVVVVLV